jgi:hypothetical protein
MHFYINKGEQDNQVEKKKTRKIEKKLIFFFQNMMKIVSITIKIKTNYR